jgi:exosortase A
MSAIPFVLVGAAFAFLFRDVVPALVTAWASDDNYSHGFLIVPLALYLVWERRSRLAAAAPEPSAAGLFLALVGVGLLAAGTLGAELFLARLAMIVVLAGAVLFLYGWRWLRVLAFPLLVLLFMIPLPALVFNQVALPLQLIASRAGTATLQMAGVPVLREGNVIVLAHTTLEVAEACSGIRSLVSLLTLATVYGYFLDPRASVRMAVALSAIPVAIVANAVRVAGTGLMAQYFGPAAAEGFFHTFSGWVVFTVAFGALFLVGRAVVALATAAVPAQIREAEV